MVCISPQIKFAFFFLSFFKKAFSNWQRKQSTMHLDRVRRKEAHSPTFCCYRFSCWRDSQLVLLFVQQLGNSSGENPVPFQSHSTLSQWNSCLLPLYPSPHVCAILEQAWIPIIWFKKNRRERNYAEALDSGTRIWAYLATLAKDNMWSVSPN